MAAAAQLQQLKKDESVEEAHFKLRSKHRIPALGLGTWKAEPNVVRDSVYSAIVEHGYRHIDCAHVYGNEKEVGAGLKAAFKAGIQRQDVFVTSKLWIKSCVQEKVRVACENTLRDLGLTYLDLYLVEMHPSWRNDNVLAYCKKENIHVTAYSPLGSSSTDLFHAPEVTETAQKLGKSPGQIMIRWLIQRGVSTIPKSSSDERIHENMEVFDFTIPAEDMEKLSIISPQIRTNPGVELLVPLDASEDEKKAILRTLEW